MNTLISSYRYLLTCFMSIVFFFLFVIPVQAASPSDFGQAYGLVVHTQNENEAVPRLKALQILRSFFPESEMEIDENGPVAFMSQREFLTVFEKFRLESKNESYLSDDEALYQKVWLRARRHNWLPASKLTYRAMQEFLYRYQVSMMHGGLDYIEGLVLSEEEINPENYASINGVMDIISGLEERVRAVTSLGVLSKTQKAHVTSLNQYITAFSKLEEELKKLNHPFNRIPDMEPEIKQLILTHDLKEVLSSITYDYSENNDNRRHNLVTGTQRMHGKLYMPGEKIDFLKELASGGWNIYKNGWVLFGGGSAWQFGGGLCGSATMTFTPSWWAGLTLITRYPHSVYYKNLYPTESLGLDATIYRGAKNLVLENSTKSPILFYVKDNPEKKEITLYLIGNSPYYRVDIEGPIQMTKNTYKWVRRMEQFDGQIVEDEIVTKYRAVY